MPDAPAPDEPAVELATVPALGGLYARGLAGSARAAATRRTTVRAGDLPDTHVVVRDVRPHADHLTAYQHLLGEPGADALPAGFVHVVAFPVATAVMVRPDFPLGLLGLVHVANRVEQRRAVRLGERLDIDAHARDLRAHRAGVTVEVVADVSVGGEHVWRGISTYLAKGVRLAGVRGGGHDVGVDAAATGSSAHNGRAPQNAGAPDLRAEWEPPLPTGRWALGGGVGRAYAAVSGDRNPIHMSALTAKAFGFPRAIAHGMYTASRALADIGPAARGEAFTWDVTFAKPVLLPSNVNVRVAREGDVWRYDAWDGRGRRHLTGSVTPPR
nr:MaoC/PaaZ C-terminal domain-containing protein [Actinotalea subterranea]